MAKLEPHGFYPPHYRRINFYGGPGTGKSTMRADMFCRLKKFAVYNNLPLNIEEAPEYVKSWAYESRKPVGFDQNYIFAKQQHEEERPLRAGVHVIISDSPLHMQVAYAIRGGVVTAPAILMMANAHEEAYPGLHIFLERGDRPYVASGRFESEEAAREMDRRIEGFLDQHLPKKFVRIPSEDPVKTLQYILDELRLTQYVAEG